MLLSRKLQCKKCRELQKVTLTVSPWRIASEILTSAFLPCALYDASEEGYLGSCNVLVYMCLHDIMNCGKNSAVLPKLLPGYSPSVPAGGTWAITLIVKAPSASIHAMSPMVKSQKPFSRALCTWISRSNDWGAFWHLHSLPSHHPGWVWKVLGWPRYPVPIPIH